MENTALAPKMECAELIQNREHINSSLTDTCLPSLDFKFCSRTIVWMLQHHWSVYKNNFSLQYFQFLF